MKNNYLVTVSDHLSDTISHQFVIQTHEFESVVEDRMRAKFFEKRVAVRRIVVYSLEDFK